MNMMGQDTNGWDTDHGALADNLFEVIGMANGFDPEARVVEAKVSEVPAPLAETASPAPPVVHGPQALVHHGRVRTGQRVVNEAGDLIILGDVNPGAELVAAGHVHVYGMMGGRVFAGAGGHPDARVFCLRFQAELVAIGGHYRVFESVPADLFNHAVGFSLTKGVLQYAPLQTGG